MNRMLVDGIANVTLHAGLVRVNVLRLGRAANHNQAELCSFLALAPCRSCRSHQSTQELEKKLREQQNSAVAGSA